MKPIDKTRMQSITEILTDIFSLAISKAYPDVVDPPVLIALSGSNSQFGDYQCNSAMGLAKIFRQLGNIIVILILPI